MTREEHENSRLFAIDAGLTLGELRSRYPDRSRYTIVHAQVRPWSAGEQGKIAGYIDKISIDEMHLPYEYRDMLERRAAVAQDQPSPRQPFEARVAFGRRLEPWLLDIAPSAK